MLFYIPWPKCNLTETFLHFYELLFDVFIKPFSHNMYDLRLYYICADTIKAKPKHTLQPFEITHISKVH